MQSVPPNGSPKWIIAQPIPEMASTMIVAIGGGLSWRQIRICVVDRSPRLQPHTTEPAW